MAKKQYTVKTRVEHDNEPFEAGGTIDLDEKQAASLLAVGAIEGPVGDAPVTEPTDPAERLAAIVAAIGQLDPNNGDLWLKDGKPDTNAIAVVMGWAVTAAERNTAWAQING